MDDIETLLASLNIKQPEDFEKAAGAPSDIVNDTETLLSGDKNIMTKSASTAYDYGRQLAAAIFEEAGRMEKSANLMTDQNARIVAEQMAQVHPVPDGDIDEVTRGLIARARGEGAQDFEPDLESLLGQAAEGNSAGHVPDELRLRLLGSDEAGEDGEGKLIGTEPSEEEIEKASALMSLVESGVSYEDAAELVKSAAEQIDGYSDMDKVAAAITLMDQHGVDFATAVDLIKAAAEGHEISTGKEHGERVGNGKGDATLREKARLHAHSARDKVTGAGRRAGEKVREVREALKTPEGKRTAKMGAGIAAGVGAAGAGITAALRHRKDRLDESLGGRAKALLGMAEKHPRAAIAAGVGAAGLAGAGAYASHEHHKKAEVFAQLVDEGYSVEQAASLIKQASQPEVSEFEKGAAVIDLVNDYGMSLEEAVASVNRVSR